MKKEEIKNFKYYGIATLIKKESKEQVEVKVYMDSDNRIYLDGQEIDMRELMRTYEDIQPIKDTINKIKENEGKNDNDKELEETDEILERYAGAIGEDREDKRKIKEKDVEENIKENDKKQGIDKTEKRKPSYVIERINPDKAKMDYWQTLKKAFGLPKEVDTLAFSYPVSSEDKVNYANITVYMLDKDGYIIDDLDVDDYFEFDTSTGNNPMQDDTIRHEKDENKGRTQIDDNNTMIRLMAKKANDKNSYISLEQKNGSIDYNDINAGKKVVGGTQNVEHQLETDRVRVRDSEVEQLVKSNAGRYNMNNMFDEAEKHKNHGDKEYIKTENADGDKTTIEICDEDKIPGTDTTWRKFANMCGYRGEGALEKAQKRFMEYKDKHPNIENNNTIIDNIEEEVEEEMSGPNKDI